MRTETEKFTASESRRRAIELYTRDTPFRQKVVELKTRYARRPKHQGRTEEWWNSHFLYIRDPDLRLVARLKFA